MKKIVAVLLALTAVFALSFSALAVDSPEATVKVNVTVRVAQPKSGVDKVDTAVPVDKGTVIRVSTDSSKGKFNSWAVYKADGTLAVKGTDYEIVEGSLTSTEFSIKVNADLYVCGNYNGKITDPLTGEAKTPDSPKTGDTAVACAAVMLLSAAFVVGANKKFCK